MVRSCHHEFSGYFETRVDAVDRSSQCGMRRGSDRTAGGWVVGAGRVPVSTRLGHDGSALEEPGTGDEPLFGGVLEVSVGPTDVANRGEPSGEHSWVHEQRTQHMSMARERSPKTVMLAHP